MFLFAIIGSVGGVMHGQEINKNICQSLFCYREKRKFS